MTGKSIKITAINKDIVEYYDMHYSLKQAVDYFTEVHGDVSMSIEFLSTEQFFDELRKELNMKTRNDRISIGDCVYVEPIKKIGIVSDIISNDGKNVYDIYVEEYDKSDYFYRSDLKILVEPDEICVVCGNTAADNSMLCERCEANANSK